MNRNLSLYGRAGLVGWRVWRGKHRATNGSTRVKRVAARNGVNIPFKDWDDYAYCYGRLPPHYPVPAIRLDVVYWNCGGISISVPGEIDPRYTYGRAFGNGLRLNYWEP